MAITNQQILQKIIAECEQALQNEMKVREHARAIQTLTDLLLEHDAPTSSSVKKIEDMEWQKMVGQPAPPPITKSTPKSDDEAGTSDSLLDF